ncbi:MAG: hypothetical protein ABIR17_09420 [Pseudolysinimonas sp.]|uniref:hypothetical protein n=1 Tax=Pseudolysinimonas sp. TaxID=2680009 RepID=UPI0032647E42
MIRRRPIFSWIAFALVVLGYVAIAGATIYGYTQTADAFVEGPPWFAVASSVGIIPVGALCLVGLLVGIVGVARREKPGWPAIVGMIFALPPLGGVAVAVYVNLVVTVACASPPGACG